jgi:hypothetical protein
MQTVHDDASLHGARQMIPCGTVTGHSPGAQPPGTGHSPWMPFAGPQTLWGPPSALKERSQHAVSGQSAAVLHKHPLVSFAMHTPSPPAGVPRATEQHGASVGQSVGAEQTFAQKASPAGTLSLGPSGSPNLWRGGPGMHVSPSAQHSWPHGRAQHVPPAHVWPTGQHASPQGDGQQAPAMHASFAPQHAPEQGVEQHAPLMHTWPTSQQTAPQ